MDIPAYLAIGNDLYIPTGVQPECVVCDVRGVPFESHHTVPRHLGGANGPCVNLCGGCHQLVHNGALAVKAGRAIAENDHNWTTVNQQRFTYLVNVIVRAMIAAEGKIGKQWKYQRTWLDEEHTKLVRLAKIYGSQDRALEVALTKLYTAHFGG